MRKSVHLAAYVAFALSLAACKGKSTEASGGNAASSTAPAAGALAMLDGFEGEIDLAIKEAPKNGKPAETVPVSLQIKSNKIRADMPQSLASKPMPKGHVVLSAPEKKLYIVMDDQKQVIVVDLNQAGEHLKSLGSGAPTPGDKSKGDRPSKPPPKVTKTGVMDQVVGLKCENWEVSEESRKVATLCITDQGASWFHLPLTGIPTEYAWALELMDGKHFPLRMIGYDKATGVEEGRFELTKLEKKPLAQTLFDVPPGYKVVDAAAMFAQLGALQGAPGAMPIGMPPGMPPGMPKKHK